MNSFNQTIMIASLASGSNPEMTQTDIIVVVITLALVFGYILIKLRS